MRDTLLDLFDEYTSFAKQLFEALADKFEKKRPPEYYDYPHCYEWVDSWTNDEFELMAGLICEKITLFGKQWAWHSHGEHCLFSCLDDNDGTEVEANFGDYNIVDSFFFVQFLKTYPPAKEVLNDMEINFHTITDLLEAYAKDGFLRQIGGVNFTRA